MRPSYLVACLLLTSSLQPAQAAPAATHTVTTSGAYTVHTFTGGGLNTQDTIVTAVDTLTLPTAVSADVILVAGGGGGGHQHAGGGGAGGLVQINGLALSAGSYPITIGGGGAGCSWYPYTGVNGGNSTAFGYTAIGGGAGTGMNQYGNSGGSGGGDGYPSGGVQGGSGTAGQGNNGSRGSSTSQFNGGGGGGAGGPGSGAYGGAALSTWAGTFAGGGGGGFAGGPGGGGGAGAGGLGGTRGSDAAPATGSGGGGGGNYDAFGGNGGSGIVIVRYLTPAVVRTVTITPPASPVYAGQAISIPTSASTTATDAEQIGFYHLEYSTNGGSTWSAVAYDVNVGKSASRTVNLTAPPAGSNGANLIQVRLRIAFRGGAAGDVDYVGGAIDWSGSWSNWQSPPAKLAAVTVANSAPTASWAALPPSPLYSGNYFVARATGSDADGNLSTIFVDASVNGGAWTPFAYNAAGVNGGNGFATTSDNNGFTAGPAGTTYQFRAQAGDGSGATSPWLYSSVYTVASQKVDQSEVSITPAPTAVVAGSSATFSVSGGGAGGYVWGGAASGTGSSKTVTFNSPGTFTVTVYSPGDATYNPSNTATSTVTVVSSASVLLSAPTQAGLYHLKAQATKSGSVSNPQDFGNGVLFEVYKHSTGAETRLWSTVFARPNTASLDLLVDLAQNDFVYPKSTPLPLSTTPVTPSSYDTVTVTVDSSATHLANLGLATFVNGTATVVAKPSPTAVSSLAADGGSYTANLQALLNVAGLWTSTYDRVEIVLPQSEYPLGTSGAASGDSFLAIAASNITLRGAGSGARLIAQNSNRMYLDVQSASNVRIENLTFDTTRGELPFLQGQVSAVNGGQITVGLDWLPNNPSRFTVLGNVSGEGFVGNSNVNPQFRAGNDYFTVSAASFDSNNNLLLTPTGTHTFVVGDKVVLKVNDSSSESALRFNYTTDCEVANVRVLSGPRLAMISRGNNGMHLDGYRIEKAPTIEGAIPRWLSTNGDGIHYQGGRRGPSVEQSSLEGMGDDGLNIYASIVDITSVSVSASGSTFNVPNAGDLRVGDVLLVYKWIDNSTRPTGVNHVQVVSLTQNSGSVTVGVAGVLNPDSLVTETLPADANRYVNVSASGEGFIVRKTMFRQNRGLGNRIQSGFGLITGNTYQDTDVYGVALDSRIANAGPDTFHEGPYPRDVVVTDNTFTHTAYNFGLVAIRVWAEAFDAPVPAPMFKNVVSQIKGNMFSNPEASVALVGAASLYPGTYNPIP